MNLIYASFPESYELHLQAGLLARPVLMAFPSLRDSGKGIITTFLRTYSYGNSPGFTPGSLFNPSSRSIAGQEPVNFDEAKKGIF